MAQPKKKTQTQTQAQAQVAVIRKKDKRNIDKGIVHIQSTFNNTIITITDVHGNRLVQCSSGACGNRGSRKGTPHAAETAAKRAGTIARESYGMNNIEVRIKGPGTGRDSAVRMLAALKFEITCLIDKTPIPHNGCRPPKKRRV